MKSILFLLMLISTSAIANEYVIKMSNGSFGTLSNYPPVVIKEICIRGTIYLVSDNGYITPELNQYGKTIGCTTTDNDK